jgi:putative tRNA adenosine deaminase-associated protein
VGDTDLLSDLGTPGDVLLELCAEEGLLPGDVMSALCERAGCLDVLDEIRVA